MSPRCTYAGISQIIVARAVSRGVEWVTMTGPRDKSPQPGVCSQCARAFATPTISACPECGGSIVSTPPARRRNGPGWLSLPDMRYPNRYVWFVLLASLDIMLTWAVLAYGGSEANPVAADVIGRLGLKGAILFKFSLVVFVIIMCEVIGRRNDKAGRRLSEWAIAITAMPVVLGFLLVRTAVLDGAEVPPPVQIETEAVEGGTGHTDDGWPAKPPDA